MRTRLALAEADTEAAARGLNVVVPTDGRAEKETAAADAVIAIDSIASLVRFRGVASCSARDDTRLESR